MRTDKQRTISWHAGRGHAALVWQAPLLTMLACMGRSTAQDKPGASNGLRRVGDRVLVTEGSPLRRRLRVEAVATAPVQRSLVVPASVEVDPAHMARITPPLAGRIEQLHVRFGDTVAKGQPLVSLSSPDLVAAQTDYLRASTSHQQAERNLQRQQDLAAHGIAAKREVEQAQTDHEVAQSDVRRAEARLRLLGIDPKHLGRLLVVRSPIAGRVVDLNVAPGEFKNDLNALLMTVADLSTVWVTANVQEKDVRRVQAGADATASFAAYPGETFAGKILFVGDLLDLDTRTVKVRVGIDNRGGAIKPGMFATVTFVGRATPEIVIPSAAVLLVGDQSRVFVEVAPWTFERRVVEIVEHRDGHVVVGNGLAAGTRIIVENAVLLQ
jgi:cobalt-zinc-cadmium efflux system membrane fusion protein